MNHLRLILLDAFFENISCFTNRLIAVSFYVITNENLCGDKLKILF